MYTDNPMLSQQIAQLEQEYAQRKANMVQNFYNQQQNNWNQQSTQAQPSQPTIQNVNWIQVSGIEGAKNQIVQPGQTAWMMDNNAPYIYVKSVDNLGSCDFHIFNINEVTDAVNNQQTQQTIDTSQYVQRDEFEKLKSQLDQFVNSNKKVAAKTNKGVEDNG